MHPHRRCAHSGPGDVLGAMHEATHRLGDSTTNSLQKAFPQATPACAQTTGVELEATVKSKKQNNKVEWERTGCTRDSTSLHEAKGFPSILDDSTFIWQETVAAANSGAT